MTTTTTRTPDSRQGLGGIIHSKSFVPWLRRSAGAVVGTMPAPPGGLTGVFEEDGDQYTHGTIVGFLVLEEKTQVRSRYTTVVGLLADGEGIDIAEETSNFVGYRPVKDS